MTIESATPKSAEKKNWLDAIQRLYERNIGLPDWDDPDREQKLRQAAEEDAGLLAEMRAKGYRIEPQHTNERFGAVLDETGFQNISPLIDRQLGILATASLNFYKGFDIESPYEQEGRNSGLTPDQAAHYASLKHHETQKEYETNGNKWQEPYVRLQSKSRFRSNTLTGPYRGLKTLNDLLHGIPDAEKTPQMLKISELAEKLPLHKTTMAYPEMPVEKKQAVVERMDLIIGQILEMLLHRTDVEAT